jgi:predicted PurR-regulated permease PerM
MELSNVLVIFILGLAIIFFIILITSATILLQILASFKRIINKGETFIDNLDKNQEEIKIKILDFIESILTRLKKTLNTKFSLPKGGETDGKKEKAQ